jgi:hypothetical protein
VKKVDAKNVRHKSKQKHIELKRERREKRGGSHSWRNFQSTIDWWRSMTHRRGKKLVCDKSLKETSIQLFRVSEAKFVTSMAWCRKKRILFVTKLACAWINSKHSPPFFILYLNSLNFINENDISHSSLSQNQFLSMLFGQFHLYWLMRLETESKTRERERGKRLNFREFPLPICL